jgi:hypothetical protein
MKAQIKPIVRGVLALSESPLVKGNKKIVTDSASTARTLGADTGRGAAA